MEMVKNGPNRRGLAARVGVVSILAVLCCGTGPALGAVIDLGQADDLALDQPRAAVAFADPADPMQEVIGPDSLGNSFLLDTGANGILVGAQGHIPPGDFFPDENLYPLELDPMTMLPIQYIEQGVAGFQFLTVTQQLNLAYTGLINGMLPPPSEFSQINNVRALTDPTLVLGSFGGILGMPGMVGRRVRTDLTPMLGLNQMDVTIVDTGESVGITGPDHVLNLSRLAIDPNDSVPMDQAPTFAPLPLVNNIDTRHGMNTHMGGDYLLDTGAQLSIFSTSTLTALGIDINNDAIDSIDVGGIGGTVVMPLFVVDEMTLNTVGGDQLVFHDFVVGALDIEGLNIAGIFGMNFLTTGYFDALFSLDAMGGLFTDIVFNFPDVGDWTMDLYMNPDYVDVMPEIDLDALLGDLGGDVVATDPESQLPLTGGGGMIPEPTSLALLALGAAALARRRRAA